MSRNDAISAVEEAWARLRPGLELGPVSVSARLLRAGRILERHGEDTLAEHGMTRPEFDVLSALRRAEGPLSPGELTTGLRASGPATTKRLKRLESAGWIARTANPDDRRGQLISLTVAGTSAIDAALPALLESERELVGLIPDDQRETLIDSLSALLRAWEQPNARAGKDRNGSQPSGT